MAGFDWLEHRMDSIDKYHAELRAEYERLKADPSSISPIVGDRVVFAAGLIGRGHVWVRREATVIEIGEMSVKIRIGDSLTGRVSEEWVSPVLITDVLGQGGSTNDDQ